MTTIVINGQKIKSEEICAVKVVNQGKSLMIELAEKKAQGKGYVAKYSHLKFTTAKECQKQYQEIIQSFGGAK